MVTETSHHLPSSSRSNGTETEGRDRAKGKRDCQDGGRACQVTREQARQAEFRVYALNTLIDVADETYSLGLRKVLGESDQEDPHPDPKR